MNAIDVGFAPMELVVLIFAVIAWACSISSRAGELCFRANLLYQATLLCMLGSDLIGLVFWARPSRSLGKVPIKLAAVLVCFYGAGWIVPPFPTGVMAMLPCCLVTLALVLGIFW